MSEWYWDTGVPLGYTCYCGCWVPSGCKHTCLGRAFPAPTPQQGWQCPVCRRVNAPWVATCLGYHAVTSPTYSPQGVTSR